MNESFSASLSILLSRSSPFAVSFSSDIISAVELLVGLCYGIFKELVTRGRIHAVEVRGFVCRNKKFVVSLDLC